MSRRRPRLVVLVTVVFASVLGCALWATSQGWTKLFEATFTGVSDGPGDGLGFPADIGSIETYTETGEPFHDVAPKSGVFAEQLVLTDQGGKTKVPFGVFCWVKELPRRSVRVLFDADLSDDTDFSAGVADSSGTDIASFAVEDGEMSFNGKPGARGEGAPDHFRVEILLVPATGKASDLYAVAVTDLDTGRIVDTWAGKIPGGYRPVALLHLLQGRQAGDCGARQPVDQRGQVTWASGGGCGSG